jgi:hypothetical protein
LLFFGGSGRLRLRLCIRLCDGGWIASLLLCGSGRLRLRLSIRLCDGGWIARQWLGGSGRLRLRLGISDSLRLRLSIRLCDGGWIAMRSLGFGSGLRLCHSNRIALLCLGNRDWIAFLGECGSIGGSHSVGLIQCLGLPVMPFRLRLVLGYRFGFILAFLVAPRS